MTCFPSLCNSLSCTPTALLAISPAFEWNYTLCKSWESQTAAKSVTEQEQGTVRLKPPGFTEILTPISIPSCEFTLAEEPAQISFLRILRRQFLLEYITNYVIKQLPYVIPPIQIPKIFFQFELQLTASLSYRGGLYLKPPQTFCEC